MGTKIFAFVAVLVVVAVAVLIFAYRARTEDAGNKSADAGEKKNAQINRNEVRKPAVAGKFYKSDKAALDSDVSGYLANAKKTEIANER